jgi:hypothetical protein
VSVSGPIGRTPRQVAGPGVDDADEDTVDAEGAVAVDDVPPDRDRAPEPDPVTEPEGATDPDVVAVPDPGPDDDPDREPVVAADADPEPLLDTEPAPDPETRLDTDAEPDPVTGLDPEPAPDPEPALVAEPAPDPDPSLDTEPEPDTEFEPEPEPEPDTEFDTEPEPEPEPEPVGAVPSAPGDGFMGERRRWEHVQASFVDDPRRAVEQADEMVSVAVAALQAQVEQRREDLAETWRAGQQASTDALLDAFQRYRDLFDGVLST